MTKISKWLVKGRVYLFLLFLFLAGISAVLLQRVNVISDMTHYLPDDSRMREGTELLMEQLPGLSQDSTLYVMFDDLTEKDKENILQEIKKIENVGSVTHKNTEDYNKENHSLFVLTSSYDYKTDEFKMIEKQLKERFLAYQMSYAEVKSSPEGVPPSLLVLAFIIMMTVLFLMCSSWVEPFLFLLCIGISIAINMGSNYFLNGVSETTHSIAAILQLVLAMDYSIILSNIYRQIHQTVRDKKEAMQQAITSAIPSVCSSSLTTIVGLLALCFMSFKIGADLGIVLAKGVLISLICVFTVLPALMLACDSWIEATGKKVIPIPVGSLAKISYKGRYVITGLFILLFVLAFLCKGNAKILYSMPSTNKVLAIFPKENSFVVLFENGNEQAVDDLTQELEKMDGVKSVNSYVTTLAKQRRVDEMTAYLQEMMSDSITQGDFLNAKLLGLLYYDCKADRSSEQLTLEQMFQFINRDLMADPLFSDRFDDEMKQKINLYAPIMSEESLQIKRTPKEMAELFQVETTKLSTLYLLTGKSTMSIADLMEEIDHPLIKTAIENMGPEAGKMLQVGKQVVASVLDQKQYTAKEMVEVFGDISSDMTAEYMDLLYAFYFSGQNADTDWTLSIEDLFYQLLHSNTIQTVLDDDAKKSLQNASGLLSDAKNMLVGPDYSLCAISTSYVDAGPEAMEFTEKLNTMCSEKMKGSYYLIGSTPMAYEMSQSFTDELNKITLITALAIFIVVLFTFRSFLLPMVLVVLIQSSVYMTMLVMSLMGVGMNYLALLIVQSILMGATIDYAIVYSNFYKEKRKELRISDAVISAYRSSVRTILTSSMIMIFVTWILGYAFADPSIGQICHIIAIGVTTALIMILCFLPGILASFDRFVTDHKKR